MKKYSVLGGISVQKFLRDYWHKQPLLIRQAIPGFSPIIEREGLFDMVRDEQVESRLVMHDENGWSFEHGPIKRLPPLRKKEWTVLVQGVNLHDDAAAELMDAFRFIPDARLDDLMISYASDGGGVGPHFDSYDVFLLQAHGKRRWRISAQQDLTLVEGLPMKILKNFVAEQEFVLEPGDMLYLPPHYAHDGVALGECMTYSVGFRAPSYQELGESFLTVLADTIELPGRYGDPDLRASRHPAEIPAIMVERIAGELRRIAFSDDDVALFLGEYLSEPKPGVVFAPPAARMTRARFLRAAEKRGVRLSRQSRMMYRGDALFINGESFVMRSRDRAVLKALADAKELEALQFSQATDDVKEALHVWYEDGWLQLR